MNEISHNLEVVKNKIADAAKGREVTLVAVSKTKSSEDIAAAYEAGQRIFGENKMQELRGKIDDLGHLDIDWHFIGRLQSNKVKMLDENIKLLQSVDSLGLMEDIQKRNTAPIEVLLQVNIGNEPQKSGFSCNGFEKRVEKLINFDIISIMGLMCIPPKNECPKEYFCKMYDIFMRLKEKNIPGVNMKYLSMGMSGDFETAIECGSNMVRIGSSIFGARL